LEDLCSSLLGHLQTLLYFPIVLGFRTFLSVDIITVYLCPCETLRGSDFCVDFITLFTLVLLRPLGGVIFVVVDFYYSILPFVPF
jgi:hypothetical protein